MAKRSKRLRRAESAPKAPVRKALCSSCRSSWVLLGPGRKGLCNRCLDQRSQGARAELPASPLTAEQSAYVRHFIDVRLAARRETDSSQWPSPKKIGAIHHSQEGADRARVGSSGTAWHRVQLFADFYESAKRRGLLEDGLLCAAIRAFDDAPTEAHLFQTGKRIVELGGLGALTPPPRSRRELAYARPAPQHADQQRRRRRSKPSRGKQPLSPPSTSSPTHTLGGTAPPRPVTSNGPALTPPSPLNSASKYTCPLCSAKTAEVAEHLRTAHHYRRYACPQCRATTLTVPGENISCECGIRFDASPVHETRMTTVR